MTPIKLRYERNTAFEHSLWDRYDLTKLSDRFPAIADLHASQEDIYGYSAVQDGWYALAQRTPNRSPAGMAWHRMQATSGFSAMVDLARKGGPHAEKALLQIALQYQEAFLRDPDDVDMPEEEDETEPEDQQQDPEPEPEPDPEEGKETEDQEEGQGDVDEGEEGENADQDPEDQEDPEDANEEPQENTEPAPEDGQPDDEGEEGDGGNGAGADMVEDNTEIANPDAGEGAIRENASTPQLDPNQARQEANVSVAVAGLVQAGDGAAAGKGELGGTEEKQIAIDDIMSKFPMDVLADFLGWTSRAVRGARRKSRTATGELTGYKRGGWSSNVHPVDMMRIAQRDPIAMAEMADRALTERVYSDNKPRGRGPVILLRDESSSMEGPRLFQNAKAHGGPVGPHAKAVALEMALATVMNEQHRDLVSIAWSSSGTRTYTYGESGLMNHLGSFLQGGTDIEPALKEATKVANEYMEEADILIITDGELHMSGGHGWHVSAIDDSAADIYEEIIEDFREDGGRIWAIRLKENGMMSQSEMTLGWTDGYVEIDDLTKRSDAMKDLIVKMASDAPDADGKKERRRV